jgi:hypothetical protein
MLSLLILSFDEWMDDVVAKTSLLLPASNQHNILARNAIFTDDFDVHNNGQFDSMLKTLNLQ